MVKKPRLKSEWAGRYVRLLIEIRNGAGAIFEVGSVMLVTRNYGGLQLAKVEKCPYCGDRYLSRNVSRVPEREVKLLPEDFRPEPRTACGEPVSIGLSTVYPGGARIARGELITYDGVDLRKAEPGEEAIGRANRDIAAGEVVACGFGGNPLDVCFYPPGLRPVVPEAEEAPESGHRDE